MAILPRWHSSRRRFVKQAGLAGPVAVTGRRIPVAADAGSGEEEAFPSARLVPAL
jgi:hypothetical protein